MEEIVKELRIRRDGGHEGREELELMCGKAADRIEALAFRVVALREGLSDILTTDDSDAMRSFAENALGVDDGRAELETSIVYEKQQLDRTKRPGPYGDGDINVKIKQPKPIKTAMKFKDKK